MLKKGEQVIIINDPTQAPIKFYHRRAKSVAGVVPTQEGLGYVNNGTYSIDATSKTTDNMSVPVPTYVTTLGSEVNYERMNIGGYHAAIDALKVTRAFRYAKTDAQVEQASIQLSGTPAVAGTTIGVEIVLSAPNKYLHQFDTVFAEGKIKILRSFVVSASPTLATIAAQVAQVFNNIEMRQNGENPEMNVVAASGTAAGVVTTTFRTYLPGIYIDSITVTETPVTGAAVMTTAYIPATTTMATPVGIALNQVGYEGRGVYNNMRMDFPETVNKVYPYAAETAFGKSRPLPGATYTAYLISLKVQSDTHGDYNSAPLEYFDYWIYVNDSCTTVITSINSWLGILNSTRRTALIAAGAVDYVAAYTAWSAPSRLTFAAPTLSTGAENITTVSTAATSIS